MLRKKTIHDASENEIHCKRWMHVIIMINTPQCAWQTEKNSKVSKDTEGGG